MEESCGTEHLSCKLGRQLPDCMMIGTPFACPHHAQMPHLELPWGQEDDFRSVTFPSVRWERLLGKEVVYCGYLIHLPTHCTPCPVLFVRGALSPAHPS